MGEAAPKNPSCETGQDQALKRTIGGNLLPKAGHFAPKTGHLADIGQRADILGSMADILPMSTGQGADMRENPQKTAIFFTQYAPRGNHAAKSLTCRLKLARGSCKCAG